MKTNFWKRAAALLLVLVLCLACIGTAFAAEDVSGKVYLISYPRDGDENYDAGSWDHDALYFRHGWKLSASDYLDVRAIGSYGANICYCIEPGVMQNTGDAFSRMGEDFWENLSDFNDLKTAITDANGELQLNDLVPGVYTVTENAAAFYEPQQPQTVTVKAGQIAEVSFSNQLKRGALEVIKTAEDGFVQGVTFRLFGTADCGQSVDVYAETDETGLAVFEDIPIGSNYTLEEVGMPERYIVPVPVPIKIAWNEVTKQTVENRLVRGGFRGIKVDETEKPLPGAVFGLFAEGTMEFLENAAFAVAESSEDGSFSFENIPYGVWLVRELASPDGYVLSDEIYEVQITENDTVIELGNLENKPITGELELTKLDGSTGKPLPNAGFRIRDAAGNGIIEGYTDENGIAKFTLRCGEYTYEEFSAPEGYLLDASLHAFAITEDGQIVRAEMTNERLPQKSETPKTGDASTLPLWIGLAAVALGGLVAVILIRAKSNKDDE